MGCSVRFEHLLEGAASNRMDAFVQSFLLSVLPSGSQIIETQSYRPDYLRYPIRVSVRTQQGDLQHCVVKKGNKRDLIEHEARVLRALTEWGIPVPTVLGELTELSEETGNGALMVLSELPGRPLPWLGITSLAEAELTCHLLIDGVTRLHRLTEQVRKHDIAATLPQCTLASEFEDVVQSAGDWFQQDLFARAIEQLNDVLTHITTQPVFSNGDYNPLNFLYDGEALTGFVDFEGACFEDPHIGFAKFLIWSTDEYGWGAGKKAGLVERYLYAQDVSRHEFAPRLVLRCLRHLLKEVSIDNSEDAPEREHLLQIITEGLMTMKVGK